MLWSGGCGGPDCEGARERGTKAYEEFAALLKEKHCIDPNNMAFRRKEIDKLFKTLKLTIEDIFVEEICGNF